MPSRPTTCLLVSRFYPLIEQVNTLAARVPGVRIEVCSQERVCGRVRKPDVGLVLAHLPAIQDELTRLLWSVAQAGRACPTVVLSDHFEEHQAAALHHAGAADCVALPDELGRLAFLLGLLKYRLRPASGDQPPDPTDDREDDPDGLGVLMAQVRRVAPQDTTLLLTGETGTGKTRLARLIHDMSPRREQPFLVVDCGSLSATLIESELFGHARGAFTGGDRDRQGKLAAGSGTLLLDEVNSLPLTLQSKLLRAMDKRVFAPVGSEKLQPVRARLIAAANAPLQREVEAGRFRPDLFGRPDVVSFHLPPLRQRRAAILPLACRFLQEFSARKRPDVTGFTPGALTLLESYSWPGNVRELRNVVERAVALCTGSLVGTSDLPDAICSAGRSSAP